MKKLIIGLMVIISFMLGVSIITIATEKTMKAEFSYFDNSFDVPVQIYTLKQGSIKVHADVFLNDALNKEVKLIANVIDNGKLIFSSESELHDASPGRYFYLSTDVQVEDTECVIETQIVDALGNTILLGETFACSDCTVVPDPGKISEPLSETVSLFVDGKEIDVRREELKGMSEGGNRDKAPMYFNVAKLSLETDKEISIELKGKNGTVISDKWVVSPTELEIPRLVSKGVGYIFIDKPQTLFIRDWTNREGEGYEDIIILITPLETDVPYKYHEKVTYYGHNGAICENNPDFSDGEIVYFDKGIHKELGAFNLKPGMKLYLAPGAVLEAKIETKNIVENPDGIKVYGRGVFESRAATNTGNKKSVYFENCTNVVMEGVGSRNAREWQTLYVNCSNFSIKNMNIMAILLNNDGIDLDGVDNFTIEDNFIMSADDCFGWHGVDYTKIANQNYPYGRPTFDVTARNNIMYNIYGNAVRFGSSSEQEAMYNIKIYDTYVISKAGYGLAITLHDWAEVHNVLVENMYIEEGTSGYNGVILAEVVQDDSSRTNEGKQLPEGLESPAGNIKDVVVRNLKAPWDGSKLPITLGGYDETHKVTGLTLENIIIQNGTQRYTGGKGAKPATKYDVVINPSSKDNSTVYVYDSDYVVK